MVLDMSLLHYRSAKPTRTQRKIGHSEFISESKILSVKKLLEIETVLATMGQVIPSRFGH